MTSRLSFRRRSWFLSFLLLPLICSLIIKEVAEAISEAERLDVRQRWGILGPRASKCWVAEDDHDENDNDNGDDTIVRCASLSSKIRLDYTIHKDSNVNYRIFQKDCKEKFVRGTEPIKTEIMRVSPSTETASIELSIGNTIIPASSSQSPVEFCVRIGMTLPISGGDSMEVNFRETNVAVTYYYRATKYKTKMVDVEEGEEDNDFSENNNINNNDDENTLSTASSSMIRGIRAPRRNSAVYMVVDRIILDPKPLVDGLPINTKMRYPPPEVEVKSLSPTLTFTSTPTGQQKEGPTATNRISKNDDEL